MGAGVRADEGGRRSTPLTAVLGADREVEPFGAPDHLEHGVADRFVAREEAMQVVHARDGLFAQADDEIAFLESRLVRGPAALDLRGAHTAFSREVEMAHVAPRDGNVLAALADARARHA